jgi:amino acid adenylation domain-containing protein
LGVVLDLLGTFVSVADRQPDRPAIVHNDHTLTYGELLGRVGAVAGRVGSRPGVVGVVTERSPRTVAALLGVLAAGGTYCPIDPAFPPSRQRAMLDAAGCSTLVDARVLPETDGPVTVEESDDPAYILFTSGSTGEPKPVSTPRPAIAVVVEALRSLFGITPDDRVLQFASLNWDTCLEEILPALTGGAALVFDDEAYTGSFPRFLRMVAQQGITVLDLPTAFWHELVRYLADDAAPLPACLRLVIIGGEAVNPARLAGWFATRPTATLLNTYGCTETTLITHAAELTGPVTRVPIGLALPHVVECIGADGELLIGGDALALGYLGRPAETAARFIATESGRFFRTGDRVGVGPGGSLIHEGRLDGELKIRGVRVHPAELEAHLAAHPSVSAAAVVGTTVADRTALIAYVVATAGAGELLDHLRGLVPAQLVPTRLSIVDELVHTATGKVDRLRTHERFANRVKEEMS